MIVTISKRLLAVAFLVVSVDVLLLLISQFFFGVDNYTTVEISKLAKKAIFVVIVPACVLAYWIVVFPSHEESIVPKILRLRLRFPRHWKAMAVFNGLSLAGITAFVCFYTATILVQYLPGATETVPGEVTSIRDGGSVRRLGRQKFCASYISIRYKVDTEAEVCLFRTIKLIPLADGKISPNQKILVKLRTNILGTAVDKIIAN
jgi:hypothetical protein